MTQKRLIEIFPAIDSSNSNCCSTDEETDPSCCDMSQPDVDLIKMKMKLKERFADQANVHIYNYSIAMDQIMAQKKLKQLFQERGFHHISETDLLRFTTPAVIVDGKLVSYAQPLEISSLIQLIEESLSTTSLVKSIFE